MFEAEEPRFPDRRVSVASAALWITVTVHLDRKSENMTSSNQNWKPIVSTADQLQMKKLVSERPVGQGVRGH